MCCNSSVVVYEPNAIASAIGIGQANRKMSERINRGTERIGKAANAISLKDYSSFLRSQEAAA